MEEFAEKDKDLSEEELLKKQTKELYDEQPANYEPWSEIEEITDPYEIGFIKRNASQRRIAEVRKKLEEQRRQENQQKRQEIKERLKQQRQAEVKKVQEVAGEKKHAEEQCHYEVEVFLQDRTGAG